MVFRVEREEGSEGAIGLATLQRDVIQCEWGPGLRLFRPGSYRTPPGLGASPATARVPLPPGCMAGTEHLWRLHRASDAKDVEAGVTWLRCASQREEKAAVGEESGAQSGCSGGSAG